MKTFNVLSLATANDRLALDLEQVISTIDKIESFYSTVAENGVSDVAVGVHLSIQEVIPEVLADVERVCKEDRFLNAFRKMYFFITNYSLEELYEMDASAEIKMKPEFEFKDPLQPGFAKLPDPVHYMLAPDGPRIAMQASHYDQETLRLPGEELAAPPEEIIVPMDVLKVKSFDGGPTMSDFARESRSVRGARPNIPSDGLDELLLSAHNRHELFGDDLPVGAKITDRLGDQGMISLQQVDDGGESRCASKVHSFLSKPVDDSGVCSQAVEHEGDLDMGIPSHLQQVASSSIHLDTVLDRLNTNGVLGIDPADGADRSSITNLTVNDVAVDDYTIRQIAYSTKHLETDPKAAVGDEPGDVTPAYLNVGPQEGETAECPGDSTCTDPGCPHNYANDGSYSRAAPTSEWGFLIPPGGRQHTLTAEDIERINSKLCTDFGDRGIVEAIPAETDPENYAGCVEPSDGKLARAIQINLAQRKAAKAKRPCDVTMRVYVQGIVEKHLPGGGVVREYSTATVSPRVIHWLEGDTFMVGGVTFTQTVLSFQTDMGENALEARINDYKRMLDKKDPSLCIYFEAQLKRLSVANRVNADFVVKVAKLAYGLLDGSVTPTNSMGY